MVIVREYVTSFDEVVRFFAAWQPYSMPFLAPPQGRLAQWEALGWRIEQHGDTAWCSVVLKV